MILIDYRISRELIQCLKPLFFFYYRLAIILTDQTVFSPSYSITVRFGNQKTQPDLALQQNSRVAAVSTI